MVLSGNQRHRDMAESKIIRGTAEAPVKTTLGSVSYVEYCRAGNVVTLDVLYSVSELGTISAWGSKTIATLPEGYRPKTNTNILMATDRATSSGTATLSALQNGNVVVAARFNSISDTLDRLRGFLSFVV